MELRRNTKPIKCSKCGKECGPGEGWAHKTAHGWVALCEEHKPRDIMAELAAVDGIVNLKGKQYVLYKGLLVLAKNTGNVDIEVELIHYDMEKKRAVCKASVKGRWATLWTTATRRRRTAERWWLRPTSGWLRPGLRPGRCGITWGVELQPWKNYQEEHHERLP